MAVSSISASRSWDVKIFRDEVGATHSTEFFMVWYKLVPEYVNEYAYASTP